VKESAGHVAVEKYIAEQFGSSWASFRPQYMIGSGNNKDCEEWFFDSNNNQSAARHSIQSSCFLFSSLLLRPR